MKTLLATLLGLLTMASVKAQTVTVEGIKFDPKHGEVRTVVSARGFPPGRYMLQKSESQNLFQFYTSFVVFVDIGASGSTVVGVTAKPTGDYKFASYRMVEMPF